MDQEDEVSYVNYQNTHEQIQMINLKVFSSKTKYDPLYFFNNKEIFNLQKQVLELDVVLSVKL